MGVYIVVLSKDFHSCLQSGCITIAIRFVPTIPRSEE